MFIPRRGLALDRPVEVGWGNPDPEHRVTPQLDANERTVLQAAAAIFAAVTQGEQLDQERAKEARKYAMKQAYLLAHSIKEMANEA
jgi:hypothetical protein